MAAWVPRMRGSGSGPAERKAVSLRVRVALALAVFGAIVSLVLSSLVYVLEREISRRLLDQTLVAELEDFFARRERNPRSLPPRTASLQGYVTNGSTSTIPSEIEDLPPGTHEVDIQGMPYRALVREITEGRVYMLFSEVRHRAREERFVLYLGSAALVVTLLSALAGLWLTGRIVRPVTELAHAVRHAGADRPPRLPGSGREDEIAELALAFDRYAARLHAFVDRERSFAADASHELRTPLAVIAGAAEVLSEDETLSSVQCARVDRIRRAVDEMTQVTSALLLLAREETGRSAQPVRIDRVVERIVAQLAQAAAARDMNLEVVFDAHPCRDTHEPLLGIVISNLVRNAVAHSVSKCVRVRVLESAVEVADSGVGMPADALDRIFERGYRGVRSEGAGIGLALVRRICERMRWRLSIDSREGAGTVATLHLELLDGRFTQS